MCQDILVKKTDRLDCPDKGKTIWLAMGVGYPHLNKKEKLELMEEQFITHADNIVTVVGNIRCTNADCPYINYVGCCTGNIENCEYKKQKNDAFLNYTFDGI